MSSSSRWAISIVLALALAAAISNTAQGQSLRARGASAESDYQPHARQLGRVARADKCIRYAKESKCAAAECQWLADLGVCRATPTLCGKLNSKYCGRSNNKKAGCIWENNDCQFDMCMAYAADHEGKCTLSAPTCEWQNKKRQCASNRCPRKKTESKCARAGCQWIDDKCVATPKICSAVTSASVCNGNKQSGCQWTNDKCQFGNGDAAPPATRQQIKFTGIGRDYAFVSEGVTPGGRDNDASVYFRVTDGATRTGGPDGPYVPSLEGNPDITTLEVTTHHNNPWAHFQTLTLYAQQEDCEGNRVALNVVPNRGEEIPSDCEYKMIIWVADIIANRQYEAGEIHNTHEGHPRDTPLVIEGTRYVIDNPTRDPSADDTRRIFSFDIEIALPFPITTLRIGGLGPDNAYVTPSVTTGDRPGDNSRISIGYDHQNHWTPVETSNGGANLMRLDVRRKGAPSDEEVKTMTLFVQHKDCDGNLDSLNGNRNNEWNCPHQVVIWIADDGSNDNLEAGEIYRTIADTPLVLRARRMDEPREDELRATFAYDVEVTITGPTDEVRVLAAYGKDA